MHRRVLLATIAAVTVTIVLLGVPLAIFGGLMVRDAEVRELEVRTSSLARSVERRMVAGEPIDAFMLEQYIGGGDTIPASVLVITATDDEIRAGDRITGRSYADVQTTASGAVVVLTIAWWDVFWRIARVVALVVLAAVGAFVVGIFMARWQARRLSAPLVYLAASAEQLGSGQTRPRLEPSGIEEIDLVASELARSADRMAARLAVERQFAADASHQLRTPLTALTMRLEEIIEESSQSPVREEARISLEQVERLVAVVDDLLARSRQAEGGTTEAFPLLNVVHQQEEEWSSSFAQAGRELDIDVAEQIRVLATPGALAQVLATLLENSLRHGAGTTTVRARESASAVVIEVADEGPGISDELAPRIFEREVTSGRGTGLGLALARDLVAADGGRLELAERRPPVFQVFLSRVPRALDPQSVLPIGAKVPSQPDRYRRRHRR